MIFLWFENYSEPSASKLSLDGSNCAKNPWPSLKGEMWPEVNCSTGDCPVRPFLQSFRHRRFEDCMPEMPNPVVFCFDLLLLAVHWCICYWGPRLDEHSSHGSHGQTAVVQLSGELQLALSRILEAKQTTWCFSLCVVLLQKCCEGMTMCRWGDLQRGCLCGTNVIGKTESILHILLLNLCGKLNCLF